MGCAHQIARWRYPSGPIPRIGACSYDWKGRMKHLMLDFMSEGMLGMRLTVYLSMMHDNIFILMRSVQMRHGFVE